MKFKEHFVKMAFDMIGDEKARDIINNICMVNRIPRSVARGTFAELKRCKYIKDKESVVEPIKQVPYE